MSSMSSSLTSSLINIIPPDYRAINTAMDEDTIIEMKDLKEKTITDLFGEQIEKMNQKIKERNKKIEFFTGLGILSGTFLGTVFTVLNNLNASDLYLVLGITSYACLGVQSTFLFFWLRRDDLKIHLDDFTLYPSLLTEFHNEFLKFQEAPEECKITSLFQKFEALGSMKSNTMNFLEGYELLSQEESQFFNALGKLYLMEAVVGLLRRQQEEESHIVKDWDLLISSSLAEGFCELSKLFWSQIEIKEPSLEDYAHFLAKRSQFKSIKISLKVNDLYRQAIHKGMNQNLI